MYMYKLDIEQSKTIQDRYTFVEEITFAVSIFAKILTRIKSTLRAISVRY